MTPCEKIEFLAEIFEVEARELSPDVELRTLAWNSLAMISLIALINEQFDRRLTGPEIKSFKTVADILAVME